MGTMYNDSETPAKPCIYHITHVNNLSHIIQDGGLWADAEIISQGKKPSVIGISTIKQRRLKLPVKCYPGDYVGQYVPFYFCPRSIMLYLIYCGNSPDLQYKGGQDEILHLEADLYDVIEWAKNQGIRWAFSLSNAGAVYTEFRNRIDQLKEVNWKAVNARDFRDEDTKEGKQAEFLVKKFFPWCLVQRIGVISPIIKNRILAILNQSSHHPVVEVRRDWYY